MNIFFTSTDPKVCADEHCDRHLVKMILESAQLLSTAHRVLDGDDWADSVGLYKKTHMNHPSAIWARQSSQNYTWLYQLLYHLCVNYEIKTEKRHKTAQTILAHLKIHPTNISHSGFTEPPKAMPDEYKAIQETTSAYKTYLNAKFQEWQSRAKPLSVTWFKTTPSWIDFV